MVENETEDIAVQVPTMVSSGGYLLRELEHQGQT